MLGSPVGAVEREGALGLDRGDVDQGPTTLALEVGQRGHRPLDLAHEVHVYHPPELLGGGLLEGGEEPHRGQVHPGVEPPVLLGRAVGDRPHLLELRSVGGDGDRLAALAPYLFHQGVKPPSLRAETTTFAPFLANRRAASRPMPLEAPIRTTTCSPTGLSCTTIATPFAFRPSYDSVGLSFSGKSSLSN